MNHIHGDTNVASPGRPIGRCAASDPRWRRSDPSDSHRDRSAARPLSQEYGDAGPLAWLFAVAAQLVVGLGLLLSGCRALAAATPSLIDAADIALRDELSRASGPQAAEVRRVLDVVAEVRRAQADALLARADADAQAEQAQRAAVDAVERAEQAAEDARAARELARAYAAAAEASTRAADAQARARDAQQRVTALEAQVLLLAQAALAPAQAPPADAGTDAPS